MVGVTNSLSKVTDTVATGITKISVNHQFQYRPALLSPFSFSFSS